MRLVLPCLTEEDSGMLMSSEFIVITCVGRKEGNRGQWGLGERTKNGAVDSEHGPARAEVRNYVQRDTIPSKRASYIKHS